jgi:CRP-like cAMP-binding protein
VGYSVITFRKGAKPMPMFIKQADLFNGVSGNFLKSMMDIAIKESYDEGQALFDRGDQADHFYILVAGCIQLTMNSDKKKIYTGSQTGETFGWSSLIDRQLYSASARCTEPTVVLKLNRTKLLQIIDDDPTSGIIFYKYLAKTLCNRLLKSYKALADSDPKNEN